MKKHPQAPLFTGIPMLLLAAFLSATASARVLDDFNAPQRSGWEDSNPGGLPLPPAQQANGTLTIATPTIGQSFFVATARKTETFELKEGRTIEFRVDMESALNSESYAVLAWIPTATGPNTLAGYGIAKSETDYLLTKGIGNYFKNTVPSPALKNQKVTLVLNMKAKGGNVVITGRVLDKENFNKVLYEQTFVDTPADDTGKMDEGKDNPSAPFLTAGNFVLYLYIDGGTAPEGYAVTYDNAEVFVTEEALLDDFNGPAKDGWEDNKPAPVPVPPSEQANGVLTFNLPPIGQSFFISSTKTTRTFTLAEGEQTEFAVDMVSGLGPDSFAVLAWIPTATGPNTLAGYGLAKSETDILLTKGIGNYFFDQNVDPPVKNQNVRLVLTLTVTGGKVQILGRVLDHDQGDAVIFETGFEDTPNDDSARMAGGKDNPPVPFLTSGKVVLYLYADGGTAPEGYQVVFDNLTASTVPLAANQPPVISDVAPKSGSGFLPSSTKVSFKVTDDKSIPDSGISVVLNGTEYTTANGLTLSAAGNSRTATLGSLTANANYVAQLVAVDSDGAKVSEMSYFDTFLTSNRAIELEDYNFDGGSYFNNPVRSPEGSSIDNSYTERAGQEGIDFHDTRTGGQGTDSPYRSQDPVRMAHTLDQQRDPYDGSLIYDYDIGDLAADEWQDYTREFTQGTYEVYLREAVVNHLSSLSVLEVVTGSASQAEQTAQTMGSFIGRTSGFNYRNVPLTDGSGQQKLILQLSGKTTLRLRHVTADTSSANRFLNYLMFVPVTDTSVRRATVAQLTPLPDASLSTVQPVIDVAIWNRDTTVNTGTIQLTLNGQAVPFTTTPTASGVAVRSTTTVPPPPDSINTARISFKDSQGADIATEWKFSLVYNALNPANHISGLGKDSGFVVRMVQAPDGSGLPSSLDRAEEQLAIPSNIPVAASTNNVALPLINMSQDPGAAGYFGAPDYPEDLVPGLDQGIGTDDFSVEIKTYLDLKAGAYRFGVVTDDGYKISSGATVDAKEPILGARSGGTADETFEFYVSAAGLYPFRMIWYERGGGANAEWFSVDMTTGVRTLINDSKSGAVKAYRSYNPTAPTPEISVGTSPDGKPVISYTGVLRASSSANGRYDVVPGATSPYTIPVGAEAIKFYRASDQ